MLTYNILVLINETRHKLNCFRRKERAQDHIFKRHWAQLTHQSRHKITYLHQFLNQQTISRNFFTK